MKKHLLALLGLVAISGCGGTEPLSLLGDPSVTPALELPLASTAIVSVTPFSSGAQYFTFNGSSSQSIASPADGVVVAIDNATQGSASVTIRHNLHLTTVISGLLTASAPVGTSVVTGASVGTSNVGGQARFATYYDGVLTCPLSFFSSSARVTLAARFSATPCQN